MKPILNFFIKLKNIIFILTLAATTSFAGLNEIITIHHFSNILNKTTTFQVYLPPDISSTTENAGTRFPVLYVLHGAWGSYVDWITKTDIEDLADNYRMILVFPDGDQFGWYLDSPIKKYSQYESYIIKELIPEIDRRFPSIASREGRSIMGLSMGDHGAFILSAKYPEMFCSVSSLSGILKLTNHHYQV